MVLFGKLGGGIALLARWTSGWDCGYETNFWYVIKDTPYNITTLKAKRRYEINKGKRNFQVQRINPKEYADKIFHVAEKAFSAYPEKYRPNLDKNRFITEVKEEWDRYSVFGAFKMEGCLCGYAYLIEHENYTEFSVLKTDPDEEKNGVNAALVDGICNAYNDKLETDRFYICDGSRAIRHETHFQDYLEKYFGFRKSYCLLHIEYRGLMKVVLKMLKPFYKILSKSKNGIAYNIAVVIAMDELCNKS